LLGKGEAARRVRVPGDRQLERGKRNVKGRIERIDLQHAIVANGEAAVVLDNCRRRRSGLDQADEHAGGEAGFDQRNRLAVFVGGAKRKVETVADLRVEVGGSTDGSQHEGLARLRFTGGCDRAGQRPGGTGSGGGGRQKRRSPRGAMGAGEGDFLAAGGQAVGGELKSAGLARDDKVDAVRSLGEARRSHLPLDCCGVGDRALRGTVDGSGCQGRCRDGQRQCEGDGYRPKPAEGLCHDEAGEGRPGGSHRPPPPPFFQLT
jgi:hypothetical protein